MKRTVLTMALVLMVGLSAGVVYENGSSPSNNVEDGQMAITSHSGSSASASASVSKNGTEWTSHVSMVNSACMSNQTGNQVKNISYEYDSNKVSFKGFVKTPNPCYLLEQKIEKVGENQYVMNITAKPSGKNCVQCLGVIEYEASFEAEKPFKLEVVHEGETVETLEHPDYSSQDEKESEEQDQNRGPLAGLFSWLAALF